MRVIDLTGIPETSYQPGEAILGILNDYGWVVVRGIRVTTEVNDAINNVANAQSTPWHSIEGRGGGRKMRYDHSQHIIRGKH